MTDRGPAVGEKGSKGGRKLQKAYKSANGYKYIKLDDGRWIAFHRYVMEEHLGRELGRGERIYFKDGDKSNCSIDNLELKEVRSETKRRYGKMDELYELIDDLTIRLQNIEMILADELEELNRDD